MFREATVYERADLAAQVLDEEIRIVVTGVTATPRVQLLVPPSKADGDTREVRQAERQLCSAFSLRSQPKLLRLIQLAPTSRIDARFHGVTVQKVKDELVHLIMEDPEALRVRHPSMALQRRLSWRIPHETIVPHGLHSRVAAGSSAPALGAMPRRPHLAGVTDRSQRAAMKERVAAPA